MRCHAPLLRFAYVKVTVKLQIVFSDNVYSYTPATSFAGTVLPPCLP